MSPDIPIATETGHRDGHEIRARSCYVGDNDADMTRSLALTGLHGLSPRLPRAEPDASAQESPESGAPFRAEPPPVGCSGGDRVHEQGCDFREHRIRTTR